LRERLEASGFRLRFDRREINLDANHQDYESLIRPVEDQMIRSVWRIVGDPEDFDEAFQEALTTIWKRLKRIRRHPNPRCLILRICINAGYDVLRRKARRLRREGLEAIPADLPDPAPSAVERLRRQEERIEILHAIGRLSRNQALAVVMRFGQEMSYQEVSEALGCREVTARKHIARARVRLRRLLAHLAPYPLKEALR
jgi:RNA polymerase sigma-70 factor (ECF subfamily)